MADPIRAALERLLTDIDDLASGSVGVAGLLQFQDLARWSELLVGGEYQEWLGDAIAQARAALAEACHANPTGQLLTADELRRAWNAQADQFNRWDHLGLDEQLEWAQRQALQRLAPGNPSAPAVAPPRPVPINERPPGPTDCNDDGDCWFDMGADPGWMLCDLVYALKYGATLWLPVSAMPIPALQSTQPVVALEQPPEPTPGEPSETFYDWIVQNSKGEQEASGGAPTYPMAWSEGHRYLAQYSQDGPHLLEISRVQVVYSLEAGQEEK